MTSVRWPDFSRPTPIPNSDEENKPRKSILLEISVGVSVASSCSRGICTYLDAGVPPYEDSYIHCTWRSASPRREPTRAQHSIDHLAHEPRLLGPRQIPTTTRKTNHTVHRNVGRRKRRSLRQHLHQVDPKLATRNERQVRRLNRVWAGPNTPRAHRPVVPVKR